VWLRKKPNTGMPSGATMRADSFSPITREANSYPAVTSAAPCASWFRDASTQASELAWRRESSGDQLRTNLGLVVRADEPLVESLVGVHESVRVEAEGEPAYLDELETFLRGGPRFAEVERLDSDRIAATGEFRGFATR